MNLRAERLTEDAFAPYGAVISCERTDVAASSANLGSAERRDFLADLDNPRPAARLNLASFRCQPWPARPLPLGMLEKHPHSTQVFVPMTSGPFLVVVALGEDAPNLDTARAFLAAPGTGIAYAPGIWHHPMVALTMPIDFACMVWEDGSALDCVTFSLGDAMKLVIDGLP